MPALMATSGRPALLAAARSTAHHPHALLAAALSAHHSRAAAHHTAASIPALAAGSRRWLRKIDRSAFDLQEGLHCRLMGDDQRPIIGIVESQRRGRILAIRRLFL